MRFFSALVVLAAVAVPSVWAVEPETHAADDIRVIEVNESGVFPRELNISSNDLFVFLLNNSRDSLVTFEIDYGKRDLHCANDNITNTPDGKARSTNPLSPRDFATPCFHEPGTYPIKFFGVGGKSGPVTASVILK